MLPKPSAGFEWVGLPPGEVLRCRHLEPVASHFFTTRDWPLGSANGTERVDSRWAAVADAAGVPNQRLMRLKQVHGAGIMTVRQGTALPAALPEADIIISDDRAVAIAVQAADCVPLLIADRQRGVVAAAHAGWRGLAAGVPRVAVDALAHAFGSRPEDLVVAVGPSIGACCYEVGDDLRAQFGTTAGVAARWFSTEPIADAGNPPFRELAGRPGKWFFDGWQAVRDQLEAAGVPTSQIHVARMCTASHAGLPSYRRDGPRAGRLAAVVRAR